MGNNGKRHDCKRRQHSSSMYHGILLNRAAPRSARNRRCGCGTANISADLVPADLAPHDQADFGGRRDYDRGGQHAQKHFEV
jgi:hypothetical protein